MGAVAEKHLPVTADAGALMKIIDRAASDPQFDVAKLDALLKVKKEWEQDEARKAYVDAMSQFKSDPPEILKSKAVNIPQGAKFSHATLAAVCDAVIAGLSKYGFSHRWEVEQADKIKVTCIITHKLGHSERTTLAGAPDDSGKKNAIQQIGSTVTYLQRYTLMAATGLAAKDMDDDGSGAGGRMDENAFADHLAAIDSAADDKAVKLAFGKAFFAAEEVNDFQAMRKFGERKDARLKALGAKK